MAPRPTELYRAPFPLYTVRLHPRRGLAITAGGGGAAKTGIGNGVHFLQLEQIGGRLSASLLHCHDTETRATMSMALSGDFIAAGQDHSCHILRLSVREGDAGGEDAAEEKGPRRRKGAGPAERGETRPQLGTCILLHMEHIVLGWVLLLGTWAGAWAGGRKLSAMKEVAMDMAPHSFDDQYQGCIDLMEAELEELNRTEFTNDIYAEGWRRAAAEWQSRWGRAARPPALRRDQATAMMAYMLEGNLYHQFNNATLTAGRSRQHYLRSYPFKALHFLLSRALQTLRESQTQRCFQVYHGIRNVRYTAQQGKVVRFGRFTSTSLQQIIPGIYAPDTIFSVETCYGAPVQNFTTIPEQGKVLIPPFEQFRVINSTYIAGRSFIQLRSHGKSSTYNCEFVKGRSSPMEAPHLWGLLLAAAALAALGKP